MATVNVTPSFICDHIDAPVIPTLPAGFTFALPLPNPSFPFSARLCCKVLQFDLGALIPPIPLGITVSPALIAALNAAITQVNTYMTSVNMICPKER